MIIDAYSYPETPRAAPRQQPAPKPADPEAGVELPTLSPLHDALREA